MSRIGRKPIPLPQGVRVTVDDSRVTITGPLGELTRSLPSGIRARVQDGQLVVERDGESRTLRALHGLSRSLLASMVEGVTNGFREVVILEGVGYRALMEGKRLQLSVGYAKPVKVEPREGIKVEVETASRLVIFGIDKQVVGQFAADLKAIRPMSDYGYKDGRGKGIRLAREQVRFKQRRTVG